MRLAIVALLAQHAWAAGIVLALLLLAVLLAISSRFAAHHQRRAARDARDELGESRTTLDGGDAEPAVTLHGTLQIGGETLERLEDGQEAAAITATATTGALNAAPLETFEQLRATCATLSLRAGAHDVSLDGPVEVRVGSVHYATRRIGSLDARVRAQLSTEQLVRVEWDRLAQVGGVVRSVGAGDDVLVRGKLQRHKVGGEASYRDSAKRWSLKPAEHESALVVAFAKRPCVRSGRRLLLLRWVNLLAVIPVVVGLWFQVNYRDWLRAAAADCACSYDGECRALPVSVVPLSFKCTPRNQEDCQRSDACSDRGRCTAVYEPGSTLGRCAALNDDDCKRSTGCERRGECTARGERCRPTAASCRQSHDCEREGRCGLEGDKCVLSDEGCKRRQGCTLSGYCTLSDGECILASNADCRLSSKCKDDFKCTLRDGACRKSPADCQRHPVCKREGRCAHDLEHDRCIPGSQADCERSTWCRVHGLCTFANGGCVGTPETCRKSERCKSHGECTVKDKSYHSSICRATSAADCRASTMCAKEQRCLLDTDNWKCSSPIARSALPLR